MEAKSRPDIPRDVPQPLALFLPGKKKRLPESLFPLPKISSPLP